ncbi:MAG: NIPSNAP family protein [Rhodospirillales bacterium]|nr:NIPSNAP family protein [Rhodospirillales bacterium]QQS14243.1 MAG: NIPSNAP family protein [Rhodospirillales bacterium]
MIFEMRTYLLKPGTAPQVEELFAASIAGRTRFSRLGGYWRTEVGTLNQIIHVWPYADSAERDRVRAEAVKSGAWPPKIADFVLDMETKILHPAPFSPHFEPGEHGGIYEFRTYTYGPGAIPKVVEAWAPRIKDRAAVSPLIFAGFTDIGPLNQWVHVWAYKDMGERERLRAQAMKPGSWPPPRGEGVVMHRMENCFAVPAKFSPLR